MIIYKITNKINGKIYIGQTVRELRVRWYEHCDRSKRKRNKIANAIQKYGKENFTIEIIEKCSSIDELNKRETFWIKELKAIKSGYNLTTGGLNCFLSKETKNKLSKIGKSQNKKISEEHKQIIRENSRKNVYQYNINGFYIKEYKSGVEAEKQTGINKHDIYKNCRKERKSAGGYRWSYKKAKTIGPYKRKVNSTKGTHTKGKKIAKVDSEGNILEIYKSAKEASRINNCDYRSLRRVCKGEYLNTNGLYFKYI